jgi:hypothetical protein
MEQRRLRLGDIVDDYCPRERRVTNHAIVAMVEDDIKQTRCTTCDAEHPYKGGSAPKRRKKGPAESAPALTVPGPETVLHPPDVPAQTMEDAVPEPEEVAAPDPDVPADAPAAPAEDGPFHRPLIRATLPRPEGQKEARPATEFTIRQPGSRSNGNFRGDPRQKQRAGGQGSNRPHGGSRFAGSRPGQQHGRGHTSRNQGGGFRQSQSQPRGGGRKRSR